MSFDAQSDIHITLLNWKIVNTGDDNIVSVSGDATDLKEIGDNQFDIVFSNSVIEHVGDFAQQHAMAQEVQRVGKRYFVQTPNYSFPIEPHFHFPGFQWLPVDLRIYLRQRYTLGWHKKEPDPIKARQHIESTRLLRKREFAEFFPDAAIYEEKFLGLTKSFIAYDGWDLQ